MNDLKKTLPLSSTPSNLTLSTNTTTTTTTKTTKTKTNTTNPNHTTLSHTIPSSSSSSFSSNSLYSRLCRNVTIYGFCKNQDKGCKFFHPASSSSSSNTQTNTFTSNSSNFSTSTSTSTSSHTWYARSKTPPPSNTMTTTTTHSSSSSSTSTSTSISNASTTSSPSSTHKLRLDSPSFLPQSHPPPLPPTTTHTSTAPLVSLLNSDLAFHSIPHTRHVPSTSTTAHPIPLHSSLAYSSPSSVTSSSSSSYPFSTITTTNTHSLLDLSSSISSTSIHLPETTTNEPSLSFEKILVPSTLPSFNPTLPMVSSSSSYSSFLPSTTATTAQTTMMPSVHQAPSTFLPLPFIHPVSPIRTLPPPPNLSLSPSLSSSSSTTATSNTNPSSSNPLTFPLDPHLLIHSYLQWAALEPTAEPSQAFQLYPCQWYKAVHVQDGMTYAILRLKGYKVTNVSMLSKVVDKWKVIRDPGIVRLHEAFTSNALDQESSLFIVYDYYPHARLFSSYLPLFTTTHLTSSTPSSTSTSTSTSTSSSSSSSPTSSTSTPFLSTPFSLASMSPLFQLASTLLRYPNVFLHPSKILVQPPFYRINAVGVPEFLNLTLPSLEHQFLNVFQHVPSYLSICRHLSSPTMGSLSSSSSSSSSATTSSMIMKVGGGGVGGVEKEKYKEKDKEKEKEKERTKKSMSLLELISFHLGKEMLDELEQWRRHQELLEWELRKSKENDRLARLLIKLNFITERPEYMQDPSWSETGDRYFLKLFRDYVFHMVNEQGKPNLDLGHVIACLNKLDAGVPDQIVLTSRDDRNYLIVSYAELKKYLDSAFLELLQASQDPLPPPSSSSSSSSSPSFSSSYSLSPSKLSPSSSSSSSSSYTVPTASLKSSSLHRHRSSSN